MDSYYGVYKGVVCDTKDPEKRGRIKCIIPDVLDEEESAWCEPCVAVAYDNGGDFCIPQLQETVWVLFEEGDPNKPVYLGNWWQENQSPLGDNYSERDSVRIINYADCTIRMKDDKIDINVGAGKCELSIENGNVTINGDLHVTGNIICKV